MYTAAAATPNTVEKNIESFLYNFRQNSEIFPLGGTTSTPPSARNSALCLINNNDGKLTLLNSPDNPPIATVTANTTQFLINDIYPYPYTRGGSSSYYYDAGLDCWRYSWSNISDKSTSSTSITSPWGSVSEASSAIGTFVSWSHNNMFWDYVMGESGCTLTILDVADPLQSGFACIAGGKDPHGFPLLTFPDHPNGPDLTDDEYRNIVTYLSSIPPLHEVDLGFVLVIDRRHDKWSAVKTLLHRVSSYFPGLVQEVLVLRPASLLQRTFSDVGFKFVKDDFKFQVVMLGSVEELHKRIEPDQLTSDLGGTLEYSHEEWIQHRAAIEKFSASTSQIGHRLHEICQTLQLTEFPNDVISTENLIEDHKVKRSEIKDDLSMTIKHGEILLGCIKTVRGEDGQEKELPSEDLPSNKLAHITAVERLLVQLEETQVNFDEFWNHHEHKLFQCLQLRRFEEAFRHIASVVDRHLDVLKTQTEIGDSPEGATCLLEKLQQFETDTMDDVEQAETLCKDGEQFIAEDHYAVDCIRPKCLELQRICEQYKEVLRRRQELLTKSKDLQDRIQSASQWCSKGIDLLSSQTVDQNSTIEGIHAALRDLEAFMASERGLALSDPKQVKDIYDDIITPEMKVALEQVLQRLVDVRTMCDQKRQSYKKVVDRPPRPVQTVHPEPQRSEVRRGSEDISRDNKQRWSGKGQLERSKTEVEVIPPPEWELLHTPKALDSDSDSESQMNTLQAKRKRKRKMQRHVMRELIQTEKIYVSELLSVLEGYSDHMDHPAFTHLIPSELRGQKQVLFGNLQEIYDFHHQTFCGELERCRETPALVGQCFVARKEEFSLYSQYCQNKVASDTLRVQVGQENPFFQECQKQLGHKLPLGAYLLKPVQRITKYQLLLKEMLKYTQTDTGSNELQEALDTMLSVVKYVNDIMHQVAITAYEGDLAAAGRLLMQGSFSVWRETKKDRIRDLRFKPMQRHIFLYQKMVMFCKKKDDADRADKASYIYKNSLQMAQVGLTESIRGDKKKFELWLHGRTEVYTIQAPNMDVKQQWVSEVKKVLLNQFDQIKETALKTKTAPPSHSNPEESITPVNAASTQATPGDMSANHYPSPKGMRKSYSTGSCTPPGGLHKTYSTDMPLTTDTTSDLGGEDGWSSDGEDTEACRDSGNHSHYTNHSNHTNQEMLDFQHELAFIPRYMAVASYIAAEPSEVSMQEGDMVEVLQIGNKGWWFIRNLANQSEGWTPASFLDSAKRSSTYSTQSTMSSGSTGKTQEEEESVA